VEFTKENCCGNKGFDFAYALVLKSGLEYIRHSEDLWFVLFYNKQKYATVYCCGDIVSNKFMAYTKGANIDFPDLFNYFENPLQPTSVECTLFKLEFGVDWIISPDD